MKRPPKSLDDVTRIRIQLSAKEISQYVRSFSLDCEFEGFGAPSFPNLV